MRQSLIDQKTVGERGTLTAAMEIEKEEPAHSCAECHGQLFAADPSASPRRAALSLQFDIRRMLAWIEAIFNSGSDRMNVIGRRALKNLIVHNQEYPYLLEHCIARCYLAEAPEDAGELLHRRDRGTPGAPRVSHALLEAPRPLPLHAGQRPERTSDQGRPPPEGARKSDNRSREAQDPGL